MQYARGTRGATHTYQVLAFVVAAEVFVKSYFVAARRCLWSSEGQLSKASWRSYNWFAAMGSAADCSGVEEESLVETGCLQCCENLVVVAVARRYYLEEGGI